MSEHMESEFLKEELLKEYVHLKFWWLLSDCSCQKLYYFIAVYTSAFPLLNSKIIQLELSDFVNLINGKE